VTPRDRFGATLRAYHMDVRVHGMLLPALLLLALAGLWRGNRRERLGITLLAALALTAIVVPSATLFYSWRYLVPLLPACVGAGALGGYALLRQSPGNRHKWTSHDGRRTVDRNPQSAPAPRERPGA
jgi:hypothetical protein